MKINSVLFSVAAGLLVCATGFSQGNIKGLVNAEKAFASFTETHTIRDGFLKYLDSNGIIFRQGVAVNGIESFQKQKPGPAILSWEPSFAVISAWGDLGITTGTFSHPHRFFTGHACSTGKLFIGLENRPPW
jgi:hypothetical protein